MAKKVVATLKKADLKTYAKVVKAVKTPKGTYAFTEEIVPTEDVQTVLNKK